MASVARPSGFETRREFRGWVPLIDARDADIPATRGVYVVTYEGSGSPSFNSTSCGGRFKGRDPTMALDLLDSLWIADANTVYIGKAGNLRRRLRQFADFGNGKAVGHWGGRAIWQLPERRGLTVGWCETPGEDETAVECELIGCFRDTYDRRPFANLRG